ncbi:MAG: DEAD/DEAH box helicase, partial [Rickettsiales bacterium]|nr:DEAD/DEAH box helicase [Rickettsiales bacterium]
MNNPYFEGSFSKLLSQPSFIFHEPYFKVQLPFKVEENAENVFTSLHPEFKPYVHQWIAFNRLTGSNIKSTLIATGTGSGKTECFLYPILEYCYKHRGEKGIKALIIYPMNALATDQARRIAGLIYHSPELRGDVTAGMYVGGFDRLSSNLMSETTIYTDHEQMREKAPDILLTNYKMLDFLLVRPQDSGLWKENDPETLKFVAVDELHTFDGAQGTDLACLLRRLKARLSTPASYLTCIGTSATLGTDDSKVAMLRFANRIFGESFDSDAVITEDRLSASQFFLSCEPDDFTVPSSEQVNTLIELAEKDDLESYLAFATECWLNEPIKKGCITDLDERIKLSYKLKKHSFFQSLIFLIGDRFFQAEEVLNELHTRYPGLDNDDTSKAALLALFALVSHARIKISSSVRPFLSVNVNFWFRELRRLVAKVGLKKDISFALISDLNKKQISSYLPVVNCRDCGETGWVSILGENNQVAIKNYDSFYSRYFDNDENICMMFPYTKDLNSTNRDNTLLSIEDDKTGESISGEKNASSKSKIMLFSKKILTYKLCPTCLHLRPECPDEESHIPCPKCGNKDFIPVYVSMVSKANSLKQQNVCPFCGSTSGLTLMGWRSATAISSCISQFFASRFNDDKKTLAFSDNVQDAAHLAGFFNSRTWRFALRGAIQQFAKESGELSLQDFSTDFLEYYKNTWTIEDFIGNFTPPNLTNHIEYENLIKYGSYTSKDSQKGLLGMLQKRIKYEIMLEYGLYSKLGRSLYLTGSSLIAYPVSDIQKVASISLERIYNELDLTKNQNTTILEWITLGILETMRFNGAFDDQVFYGFAKDGGKSFLLSKARKPWMPGILYNRNTPRFPYTLGIRVKGFTDYLDLLKNRKYSDWIRACLNMDNNLINNEILYEIAKIVMEELTKNELINILPDIDNYKVWGLNKSKIKVTTEVQKFICDNCGSTLLSADDNSYIWEGAPCRRIKAQCNGHYKRSKVNNPGYFTKLYEKGDLVRVNAHEHTGILSRNQRESLEKSFKLSSHDRHPWDTNILTCTPTMELGIDIGDLSSVILCNVPPEQAQFFQRSGRAGRKDGNALIVNIANTKPHDLYFHAEPTEMISGKILPPTIFLNAPAVLERQFFAFSMDTWVKNCSQETPLKTNIVPKKIIVCLNNLEKKDSTIFPFNLLNFIKNNLSTLHQNFVDMFEPDLSEESVNALLLYSKGDDNLNSPMHVKLLEAFYTLKKQKESLTKNIKDIRYKIIDLNKKPSDITFDNEIKSLKMEQRSLVRVLYSMNNKNIFNFLSDEGLLPNYAFPESGVILKAVIKHSGDNKKSKYNSKVVYDYNRSASSAISEFAPTNTFYVDGRKFKIDQIDLSSAQHDLWRLCPNCSYTQLEEHSKNSQYCPRCGTNDWADIGQLRELLKVKMVYSNNDEDDLIEDDKESRISESFVRQLLVDVDEKKDIIKAYSMKNDDFPFGFDFAKKAHIMEINFGRNEFNKMGENLSIAGQTKIRKGFKICKYCGKIQTNSNSPNHMFSCPAKKNTNFNQDTYMDCLFLYREFQSEALRLIVPATTIDSTTVRLESFTAAIMLGLREHFGNVDHLSVTIAEVPVQGVDYKKNYLVIFDSVPGGTGYLKQLAQAEVRDKNNLKTEEKGNIIEIFEKALAVLESCPCKDDPLKDGCYHCLFAYRQSKDIGNISRKTAINLLRSILNGKKNLEEVKTIESISIDSLFESELERRFVEALSYIKTPNGPVTVNKEFINNKEGYLVNVGNKLWELEPQVEFFTGYNFNIKSRADFVFWPSKGCSPTQK